MPEIKNQFTGGKMNKDLDERLIPKGEYRDAMNIQVSTSEGSDVGAVQNILGNTLGCTNWTSQPEKNPIPSDSFTVGSIADEKNDSLYWLISGEGYSQDNMVESNTWDGGVVTMKDLILKKGPVKCEPVFVDIFAFSQPSSASSVTDVLSGVALSVIDQLQPGWTVTGVTDTGLTSNTSTIVSLGDIQNNLIGVEWESEIVATATNTLNYVGNSPRGVANGIYMPLLPLFTGGWEQQTSSFVYINGFNGTPSTLIGDTIEILPYHSTPQTFTILNAITFGITLGNGASINVVKVTLDDNLTVFTGPPVDQPSAIQAGSPTPFSSTINGSLIDALITSQDILNLDIATGELTIDINDFDVANIAVGEIVYKDNTAYVVRSKDTINNSIILEDNDGNIHDGWQVGGSQYDIILPTGGSIIIQSQIQVQLDADLDLSTETFTSLLYRGPRTLNFNHNNLITGINIIDDMLFWTDGKTEPKKINITRSILGSNIPNTVPGFEHTRLINESQDITIWNNILVREEHVTVIKKAPLSAPSVRFETTARNSAVSGFNVGFTGDFNNKVVGETLIISATDAFGFEAGDIIRLSSEIESFPSFDLRVQVIGVDALIYTVKIMSISQDADLTTNSSWFAELEALGSFLFERKLPRFAYRYRYLDNEYSSFSPFTNVAFFPGNFDYEPIKAYNKGMTNTIESLAITDFITPNMPQDVMSVDLLYKNETSPVIYLVDTVSYNDELIDGENSWTSAGNYDLVNGNSGSYNITNENIAQALPSNQSLRSWDNVPKKALAQEISGNRIIYGNYTQGYDVKNDSGKNITPDINLSVRSNTIDTSDNSAKKSIKSLRNYEVGVVWGDKYGRETPVIASKSGSVLVPKSKSKTSNHLNVSLNSSPNWSDYYRFYVKETSNEYYNLAVDRTYDASDGSIWVSFPSVDRNKIDEDSYIILKKGVDSEELVDQEGRYKVVAIENEAPDYIKTSFDLLARSNQDETHSVHSCNLWGGTNDAADGCTAHPQNTNYLSAPINPPIVTRKSFSMSRKKWSFPYDPALNHMGLADLITIFKEVTSNSETINNELYVSFTKETPEGDNTTVVSGDKYRVIDVELADEADDDSPYVIHLEKPIGINDDFVVQDSGTSTSGVSLQSDGIHIFFWQKSVTNKPEFDGRFFVKILSDQATEKHLSTATETFNSWTSTNLNIYKIEDPKLAANTDNDYNWSTDSKSNTPATPFDYDDTDYGSFSRYMDWFQILKFGGGTQGPIGAWFIDNAPFAGVYSNFGGSYTTSFNDGNADYDSCDLISTIPTFLYNNGDDDLQSYSDLQAFAGNVVSGLSIDMPLQAEVLDVGTGASLGRVGMKGAHTKDGSNYLDLSYSIIDPEISFDNGGLAWDVGLPNTSTDEQTGVVNKLKKGTRFKLKGGLAIFKILSVQKFRLLNFAGAPSIELGGNQIDIPYTAYYNGTVAQVGAFWNVDHRAKVDAIEKRFNKRVTYRIKYELDTIASPNGLVNGLSTTLQNDENVFNDSVIVDGISNTVSGAIQFLEEFNYEGENKISSNPAVFETEPKEDVGLDLYYEASSSLPVFPLNNRNKFLFMPIGTTIVPPVLGSFPSGVFVTGWSNIIPGSSLYVNLSQPINEIDYATLSQNGGYVEFLRDDGTYVTATIADAANVTFYGTSPNATTTQLQITPNNQFGLNWHNCWSFNNGVESNRVGDTFNKPYLSNGVTLSTTIKDSPGQENRRYGLIYSGIYNSNSGVNSLNQFIAAEKITKDINPTHGSIQKLYAGWGKSGSLVALCEDRVLSILANKDALFNADGNPQLTATDKVLGTATPYAGEYGISENPESFASDAYRIYFTDKTRGSVMRLSQDGLTPISDHGMKDWFRDNLKLSNKLIGSYDSRKSEYNLTLKGSSKTVSFKEDVKGWASFKSFTPEDAISCANEYYTFNNGLLWKHHDETGDRNTFYKDNPTNGFTPSSINVILNDQPGTIKTFHALNYEGSQSKVESFTNYDIYLPGTNIVDENISNNEYYNISSKAGWKVQNIQTDLEEGSLNEFIKKEGKWFNYIKGKAGSVVDIADATSITSGFDNADFSFQGIGTIASTPEISNVLGCTANGLDDNAAGNVNDQFGDGLTAINYDPQALVDDGGCVQTVPGCTYPNGGGYNALANVNDGSCVFYGCDNIYAINYDPNAGFPVTPAGDYIFLNDGSCTAPIYGCMWLELDADGGNIMTNYNALANTPCNEIHVSNGSPPNAIPPYVAVAYTTVGDNGCCVPFVYGCMDSTADNYNASANTQTVSSIDPTNPCFTTYLGCTDSLACNYNDNANTDDGSCAYCNDALANNYDGVAGDGDPYGCSGNTGCLYCKDVANLQQVSGGGNQDTTIDVSWDETWSGNAQVAYYELRYSSDSGATYNYLTNIPPGVAQGTVYQSISGLTANTPYTIEVKAICSTGTSVLNPTHNTESGWGSVITIATVETQVTGCMDSLACNYDPLANNGNPSQLCEYVSCAGCTDPIATNTTYFVDGDGNTVIATIDDSSCLYINGCTDTTAFNWDPLATFDDGSCVAVTTGCLDDSLNNSGSTYAATNYGGANTQNIAGYTPPTPAVNTVCNNNGTNNDCCTYIMPTFYNAQIDPTWGGSGVLNTNGWGSTSLWGTSGVNESRKVWAYWDVSLSPKIMLNPAGNAPTKFAYFNDNGYGAGPQTGDITSFNVPSALRFKVATSPDQNHTNTNSNTFAWNNEDGIDNLELISFESTVYSGKVFFGQFPQDYPPNGGTGAHAQVPKFNFWENHIAAYTPPTETYNVYLGCNDPNAWANYSGEVSFFDNSICLAAGIIENIATVTPSILVINSNLWVVSHDIQWEYDSDHDTDPTDQQVEVRTTTGDGVIPPPSQVPLASQILGYSYAATHSLNFSTNHFVNPSNAWIHYRIRPRRVNVLGDEVYGAWVDHWDQTESL